MLDIFAREVAAESGRHNGPADLALANRQTRRGSASLANGRLYRNSQLAIRAGDGSLADIADDPRNPLTASPLSRREREVAVLVAHGLTNRQIAEALVITEKTAEVHVSHILSKLGLSSRAQLAAWTLSSAHRSIQPGGVSLALLALDLKNPLAAIQTGAQILERYARPVGGEQWRAGLVAIQASVTRMNALLEELLDGARQEAPGLLEWHRRSTDLVAQAREPAHYQTAAPSDRVCVEATASTLVGLWGGARMERVLDKASNHGPARGPEHDHRGKPGPCGHHNHGAPAAGPGGQG
jgi:DNA-binding CsgD family transcriptional regulator